MNPPVEPFPNALDRLLYTATATARILQITTDDIETLTAADDGCRVSLQGKAPTIDVPRTEYIRQFVADRQARSQTLTATQNIDNKTVWTVWNESNDNRYTVTVTRDFVHCDCPDWQNQQEAFAQVKVCCKHGYAVLRQLGFGTLKDYLKAWRADGKLSQLQAKLTQKRRK
jgi:hypothetical protein